MRKYPLNVLQVGSGFPGWGGTELHLLNLSEQLVQRGHRVTVACRPGCFIEEQAKMRRLPTVAATLKKQQDWRAAKTFLRLMRAERFDVVHVHAKADYIVAPTIAHLCHVPVVLISHHLPHRLKTPLGRFAYGRVLFNRIIALSESVRRMLLDMGMAPDKVVTIHHGTDTAAFARTTQPPAAIRTEWGVPEGALVAGMVGRIASEKGVLTFLEALAQLRDHALHGVLVGDGPQEVEARRAARELGLSDRVTFAGFRQDVNNAVDALDVLVLASVWQEPCSAVVQQAMALAKPVVGTNLGGTPEMIVDGQTGLLVPPGDARALAEALRALAADPARRAAMGARGKDRVEALFTLSGMTDKIQALYYELWAEARGNPPEPVTIPQPGWKETL